MSTENTPAAVQTEGRIQADSFQWFNNKFPELRGLLYHVPNGGLRTAKEANDFKAMGVISGIPDIEFHFYKRTFFFEFKTPTGILSKEQKKIHSILHQHGFRVFVVRSTEEFQNFIWSIIQDKSYIYQRGLTKEDFEYRNRVFNFLYDIPFGDVKLFSDLVSKEKLEKFKGVIIEFISDNFDKISGFEILFTPDYSGIYKKSLSTETEVHYQGTTELDIPN